MDHREFDEFVETIAALRAPGGCPWDREQTHKSIAPNMIEEAYEAVEAIEEDDTVHLREELGDVLLQVVLQSQIAADAGEFTIDDVCRDVNAKIVRRHPHVFGDAKAGSSEEVLAVWDKIKAGEKGAADGDGLAPKRRLGGVPKGLPALTQAQKLSRKAAAAGFDWEGVDDVWAKVEEEESELKEAYAAFLLAPKEGEAHAAAKADVLNEMGDVLFSLVNVARKMGVSAEEALRATCSKFRRRWEYMEDAAEAAGTPLEELSQAQQERLWNQAKA